jgi:hypothetical protein
MIRTLTPIAGALGCSDGIHDQSIREIAEAAKAISIPELDESILQVMREPLD